jgi:hypothetical protein
VNEIKGYTASIPSGSPTSQAINLGGYKAYGLFLPALSSGYVVFQVAPSAGAAFSTVRTQAAVLVSAHGPNGTAEGAVGSDGLSQLAGFHGQMRISASVAQAADRTIILHGKM